MATPQTCDSCGENSTDLTEMSENEGEIVKYCPDCFESVVVQHTPSKKKKAEHKPAHHHNAKES